ncbi:phage tail protein [Myxococcus sp. 1LA]
MTATPTFRKPIGMRRKLHKAVRLGDDAYDICEPSQGDKINVLAAAQKAKEVGEDNKPADALAAWNFVARVACACLYHPGGARRVFTDEDIESVRAEPWLEEHQADFVAAFNGPSVEDAKGNSEATPS